MKTEAMGKQIKKRSKRKKMDRDGSKSVDV